MRRRRDGWPEKARADQYLDAQGRYILLTSDVFEKEWGPEWTTLRSAKAHSSVDFSGRTFFLETLVGEPEKGLLHPGVHRENIEVLNVSKNQLTDINCLNNRTDGRLDFRNLQILNASRNMLTEVRLELGNLTMLNLSYNELVKLPSFSMLKELQKLVLSHNQIDGTLREFASNTKLWFLDISSNQFSWRPSLFKEQLDVLERCHIRELKLWPNPFAEQFKEYQFLTVTALDSLTSLDGFLIDHDLRAELRMEADKLRAKGVDYTIFDIKVEEKKRMNAPAADSGADIVGSNVPRISELISTLNRMLDRPDELQSHNNAFEEQVKNIWGAHYRDRRKLMEMVTGDDQHFGGQPRPMSVEEERQIVNEFSDKMQQVLERYDSVQDVLVMCLVRLVACGSMLMSQRCAKLLAEWIDASASEFQGRINEISRVLFKDLCLRAVGGMQSFNESPFECYEASHGRMGENAEKWGQPDKIAECACIMRALSYFGSSAIFSKADSPYRSIILEPLLPALCREPHHVRGPDQPSDEWSAYPGFDAFPSETAETMELQEKNLAICQERCARFGHGGFVTEESPDSASQVRVMFKPQMPDALVGLRAAHPGRTLHVRPTRSTKMQKRAPDSSEEACEAWAAWSSGLAVLAVATGDKFNAARCISDYGIHRAICRHDSESSSGFTEAWMLVTEEASRAFVLLLKVAQNLTRAAKPHGQEATKYFMEHKLHVKCWSRARRRLMENGAAIPLSRLNEMDREFTMLISSLVGVVCAMTAGGTPEVVDAVMTDLRTTGLDVFDLLLDVCAYAGVPDPLLFATSLEMIYTFLDSSVTQSVVLARVLNKLHDSAILLPYIRGPKVNDVNNLQYQEIWRACMVRYASDSLAAERMPEVFATADYTAEQGRQAERGKWRSRVPELRDLQHPLMHRVLLGIVRLIKLFSLNSQTDATGLLKNVAQLLDTQGRERLLIGPATGLVMCPDYDVKIECLQVIEHVLVSSPQQLSAEEMGWLLQYLTNNGLGIGKQEEFLTEVLQLIILLVTDGTKAGQTFRQTFAKLAIRESFEILRLNSRREPKGDAEEESKKCVSLKTITLLQVCSRPLSGNLRKFLRRVDFLDCMKEIIHEEDRHDRPSTRAALLNVWTGRNVREVLLPLLSGSDTRPRGRSRYRVVVRLADVLSGKVDWSPDSRIEGLPSSREQEFWASLPGMLEVDRDQLELEDWGAQQEQFVAGGGMTTLLNWADRYLTGDVAVAHYKTAQGLIESFKTSSCDRVKKWWEDNPSSSAKSRSGKGTESAEEILTGPEECFMARLRMVNQRVSELYNINLNVYDEKRGSSLVKIAKDVTKVLLENQELHKKHYGSGSDYYELLNMPTKYLVGSRLMSLQDILKKGVVLEKPRQPSGDLKRIVADAAAAHQNLKSLLLARLPHNDKEADEWARAHLERGKEDAFHRRVGPKGLTTFLRKHDAQVIDPGLEPQQNIERKHRFKYFNDNSRVRNASRLIIEYPDATRLNASLTELQSTNIFSVVKIRNLFRNPTNFGKRCVLVTIELQMSEAKHLCELELVIRNDATPAQDTLMRENRVMATLEKSLRDNCQVKTKVEQVAEYLSFELQSRAIRHGDTVYISLEDKNLEVQKEELFARAGPHSNNQVFIIERELGVGPVKSGDIIALKSKGIGKYLDMAPNGQLRIRFTDVMSEQSNLRFVIEIELVAASSGVAGGLVNWFGGDSSQPASRGKEGRDVAPATNLHTGSRIKLKAKGGTRYFTVMAGGGYLGLGSDKQRVKGQAKEDRFAGFQSFLVQREGSLVEHLKLDSSGDVGRPQVAGNTTEEKQEQVLLQANMCAALPTVDTCPGEGGAFRRAPPHFKVVAQRQAEGDTAQDTPSSGEDKSNLESEFGRMPLFMSAILRCEYVLVELGKPALRHHALEEVLGGMEGMTMRLLMHTMTVQLACHNDTFEEEPDIISAWLPAKLLRLFSGALGHLPTLAVASQQQTGTEGAMDRMNRERQKELQKEARREDRGEYDMKRIFLLDLIGQYLSRMLVQPLLVRLGVVAHRSLSIQEVVLLREFATIVDRMVYNYFATELRCQRKHSASVSQQQALSLKDEAGPAQSQGANGETEQAVAVAGPSSESSTGSMKLSSGTEAEIFSSLVPSATTRVLVHSMLYGVHQEAIAFTTGFRSSQLTVRLISSLANRSMVALASVIQGRSASESTDCEFDVCEAVSQAMSNGAQLVPRARITQLMEERALDKLRGTIEEMLQDGSFNFDGGPTAKPTERVVSIGRAWAGPVNDNLFALPRCIVAVTSRLNLAVVVLPPDAANSSDDSTGGPPPAREDLTALSFRDLRGLRRLVVQRKMRQFLGLVWDTGEVNAREVLIFDSSARRRAFQMALRMVDKSRADPSSRDHRRGVPTVQMRKEVVDALQESCKTKGMRNNTALVNVTFVRCRDNTAASSWTDSWAGGSAHQQAEALILTVDSVAVITLGSFLQQYVRPDDEGAYASQPQELILMDTDSEDETDIGVLKPPGQVGESTVQCQALYSSPWQLRKLQGVWFLAEAEPRIKLRFDKPESFLYTGDGERQRWRRHLAAVLANQERRQDARNEAHQGWSVVATGKTEISDVKQYAMSHVHRSLVEDAPVLALTDTTKAGG